MTATRSSPGCAVPAAASRRPATPSRWTRPRARPTSQASPCRRQATTRRKASVRRPPTRQVLLSAHEGSGGAAGGPPVQAPDAAETRAIRAIPSGRGPGGVLVFVAQQALEQLAGGFARQFLAEVDLAGHLHPAELRGEVRLKLARKLRPGRAPFRRLD